MLKKLLRSRTGFEKPESREEAIMQNILGASNVLEPSESNIEEILKSILYNTPYTKEAEFEIEKILLAIKNNGTYDGEGESRDMKILIAILKGFDYTEEAQSRIEELFIEWLQQRSQVKVLEGVTPLTFTSRGLPLINYLIEGNTVQNGTPTPDNPVDVNGVGERTENLFDVNGTYSFKDAPVTIADNSIKFENVSGSNLEKITYSNQYSAGTYHIYCTASGSNYYAIRLFSNSPFTEARYNGYYNGYYRDFAKSGFSTSLTFDNDFNIGFISNAEGGATFTIHDIMFSTMEADFEPYGYKIPISSANTTTPVYLGEVETTRKIKKLVLTGNEDISLGATQLFVFALTDTAMSITNSASVYCTHYEGVSSKSSYSQLYPNQICSRATGTQFWIRSADITTVEDFKSYLAAQYAAGTPVTVWYVLATEETGIVNEPLMKIGEYADTLSMEQAGAQIPTVNGSNTLDVDTTVKPSNVYIEYK